MREPNLPESLKDRFAYYNVLWCKKMRGEDLMSFSHMVSDDFTRTIQMKSIEGDAVHPEKLDLTRGELIFEDKFHGFKLVALIKGNLEDLRDNVDSASINNDTDIFDFCKLAGEIVFENDDKSLRGNFRDNMPVGAFYKYEKANKWPGEKGPKDGSVIGTIRQFYNRAGQRHDTWYVENAVSKKSIAYQNGEVVPGSEKTEYKPLIKTRAQKMLDGFLSIGAVSHIVNYVARRRGLAHMAVAVRTHQGR